MLVYGFRQINVIILSRNILLLNHLVLLRKNLILKSDDVPGIFGCPDEGGTDKSRF
jgi:hypothetical protein